MPAIVLTVEGAGKVAVDCGFGDGGRAFEFASALIGVNMINMKIEEPPLDRPRKYRQSARAEAAAGTHQRIVQAFIGFLRDRWLDEITLNEVAEAAGVTVQTVIRRFSGKEGLLKAAVEVLDREIDQRREAPVGDLRQIVEGLVRDYEEIGDMVVRCLAQEERNPVLKILLDTGRREHPKWLAESFAPWLSGLSPERREQRMAELIAVTDVYIWKLLRRDHGKTPAQYADVLYSLVAKLLAEPDQDAASPPETTP